MTRDEIKRNKKENITLNVRGGNGNKMKKLSHIWSISKNQ